MRPPTTRTIATEQALCASFPLVSKSMAVKVGRERAVDGFGFDTVTTRPATGFRFVTGSTTRLALGSLFFTARERLAVAGFAFRFTVATRLIVAFGCAPRFFAVKVRLPVGFFAAMTAPSCL